MPSFTQLTEGVGGDASTVLLSTTRAVVFVEDCAFGVIRKTAEVLRVRTHSSAFRGAHGESSGGIGPVPNHDFGQRLWLCLPEKMFIKPNHTLMKTLKTFRAVLFAAAFVGASLPQSSDGAFWADWSEYNKGHFFVGFRDDQNAAVRAAWLLNKGVPTATLWFAEGGDWSAYLNGTAWYFYDACVHHDGSVSLLWAHLGAKQLAVWIISSAGALTGAGTFSHDEGNPWYRYDFDCLCNYTLLRFYFWDSIVNAYRWAWWLVGPGGTVEKTLFIADDSSNQGWRLWSYWVDDPRGFILEFLYDNGTSTAYAVWLFNTKGDWIGASTLFY